MILAYRTTEGKHETKFSHDHSLLEVTTARTLHHSQAQNADGQTIHLFRDNQGKAILSVQHDAPQEKEPS